MKTVEHSLHFITELDETHPLAIQLLGLDKEIRNTKTIS